MKRALKIGVFLILLAGVYLYVDGVLKFKYFDGIEQLSYFYKKRKQSMDVFFVGTSHVFAGINPVTVWKEAGIPSYDLAAGYQTFWNSYFYIKEGLKYQKPKVIVLDVYAARLESEYDGWIWIIKSNTGFKPSKEKIESIFVSSPNRRIALFLGFPAYHSRYNELSKRDFVDAYAGGNIYMNGNPFYVYTNTSPQTRPDSAILNTTEEKKLHPKVLEYLFKIIELAKERDIQLVLIAAPYVLSSVEQECFNSVARIAEDNGLPFINYNMLYDELGFDFDTDFNDWSHLNYRGAEKLSRHIAAFLADEYRLPDRRNDPAWADWNVWAERCENVMAEAVR